MAKGALVILAVCPSFFPVVGGAELLVYEVLRRVSRQARVRLITPVISEEIAATWGSSHPTDIPFEVIRFVDRLNTTRLPGHKITRGVVPPVSVSAVRTGLRECRRSEPDVVFSFYLHSVGLAALAAARVSGSPLVPVICGTDVASGNRPPLWRRWGRMLLRRADSTVYVSDFTKRQFWGSGEPESHDSTCIPNGVDMSMFNPGVDGRVVRENLSIAPGETMILSLQRLAPDKRVDIIIKAMPRILTRHPRTKLVIAGIGSERGPLRDLVDTLGLHERVVFVDYLGPERAQYFAAADIFTFHSCCETFGIVLAEAMASGKPIVTVDNSAIPEVVTDDETGLLCPDLDSHAMASQVIRLIEDPALARRLGRAAAVRAVAVFNIEDVAARYLAVAEEAVLNRLPRRHRDPEATKRKTRLSG